jgi:predicted tellurium resistance membrane protein TerC
MTDIVANDAVIALIQVVMINLVLSGDNAVVIGLAAAGLPGKQRTRAITIGILTATALRIARCPWTMCWPLRARPAIIP